MYIDEIIEWFNQRFTLQLNETNVQPEQDNQILGNKNELGENVQAANNAEGLIIITELINEVVDKLYLSVLCGEYITDLKLDPKLIQIFNIAGNIDSESNEQILINAKKTNPFNNMELSTLQ